MDELGVFTLLVVLLVICSGVATAGELEPSVPSATDESADPSGDVTVPEGTNETQVVVQLERAGLSPEASPEQVVRELKRHANRTQRPVESFAANHGGVTVVRQFWLTNTVVLEVTRSRANVTALARIEDVTELHTNFEVNVSRPASRERATLGNKSDRATAALERVGAPAAWREFDARGDGVKVAVLDNGVDVSHPDIDLYATDADDPTYPGGWAEFDENGERVRNSTPHVKGLHGMHMSGIVAGGNASGTSVGVAPEAELMHGLVVTRSTGSFARVLAGIQWAVEQDADVISLSLGVPGYPPELVEPIRRAEAAGTVVVASVGNQGFGTSNPPANVYEAVAVGAVTQNGTVASFSGRETIVTESAWGSAAPEDWPRQYTIPDVVAPGVAVESTVPGGYEKSGGTSVATPFVAGTVALMLSAADDRQLSSAEVRLGLTATATPAWESRPVNRTGYGSGIVNAYDATAFAANPASVAGRVTTPTGEPAANATITLAGGRVRTSTDSTGRFSISTPPGTWNVTASGFGYGSRTTSISTRSGSNTSVRFQLNETLAVEQSSEPPELREAGRSFHVDLRLANAESVTVELGANSSVDPSNVRALVGDRKVELGESVSVSPDSGALSVGAITASGTDGSLELQYTVRGEEARRHGRVESVTVVPRVVSVGVVDVAGSGHGSQVASTLDAALPEQYRVRNVTAETAPALTDEYDVFVVQRFGNDSDRVARFVEATDGRDTGVVFLGSYASDFTTAPSDAIRRLAATGDKRFEVHAADDGDGPVSFELLRNHSLFEGIGTAGEEIDVYDSGSFGDRSWFDQSPGTPLATVRANGTEYTGVSVAVDASRRHVLMTLGREVFIADAFTESADELLANAVSYVTPPPTSGDAPVPV